MDREEHLRSYQDGFKTYQQIFSEIATGYQESRVSFYSPLGDAEGKLILQYYETDWQFLKRLASRK